MLIEHGGLMNLSLLTALAAVIIVLFAVIVIYRKVGRGTGVEDLDTKKNTQELMRNRIRTSQKGTGR